MSAGTLYDAGALTLEVRIRDHDRHRRDDILAPEAPLTGSDEDCPIASAALPGYGTE